MEISPGIYMIPSVRWARVYLIAGDTLTLVDSGLSLHPRGILKYIRSIGRNPNELKQILVTHSHPDHTGMSSALVKATGASIAAHRSDTIRMSQNRLTLGYESLFGKVASPLPLLSRVGVNILVEEGDILPIHGGIRVIHTPGHTRGSVCFLLEESKILFSGDTIFSDGKRISRSVPFPGYDRDNYIRSLKRLSEFDFEGVFGGHGFPMLKDGGQVLSQLLESHPEPPTWGNFLSNIPKRINLSFPLTGEFNIAHHPTENFHRRTR